MHTVPYLTKDACPLQRVDKTSEGCKEHWHVRQDVQNNRPTRNVQVGAAESPLARAWDFATLQ